MSKYRDLVELLDEAGVMQLDEEWAIKIQDFVSGTVTTGVHCTGHVDYSPARSELTALRGELAEIKESLVYRGSLLNRTRLRAEAAEQRNADQYGLLLAWYEKNAEGLIQVDDAAYRIVTATAEMLDGKPTESGESE